MKQPGHSGTGGSSASASTAASALMRPSAEQSRQPAYALDAGVCGQRERVGAATVCALVAVLLSTLMGRDLNWDYFNYHGYAALSVLNGRTGDFFAAGYQGYLNPLPYLPFALMVAAGWHSVAVAAGLAVLHSINVYFLYLICRKLTADYPRGRILSAVLTVGGAASSAFLGQVGSSFVDPITTPPVMAALWLLIDRPDRRRMLVACALSGVAAALKLTNAPFAVGIWLTCALLAAREPDRGRRILMNGAACIAGFVLFYGVWGWQLYREFGSPFFPLFNNLFQSADFPSQSTAFHRFVPQSIWQALSLPFLMAQYKSWIYAEILAPDIRPAVAAVMMLALVLRTVVWRRRDSSLKTGTPEVAATTSAPWTLGIFFVASALPWLLTSANGRYATPLLILLGPIIFLLARPLFGMRHGATLSLLVITLQIALVFDAGNPRWSPRDWTRQWLPAQVPAALAKEPRLFITVGTSSESYIAGHVHPDSAFINPIGFVSILEGGPGWSRLRALQERFAGRTQAQIVMRAEPSPRALAAATSALDDFIERLDLTVDRQACVTMSFDDREPALPFLWGRPPAHVPHFARHVLSCPALARSGPNLELRERRALASRIMDAYERRCPEIFFPHHVQTEGTGPEWTRNYGKFDIFLRLNFDNESVMYYMERQGTPVFIGGLRTWERDVARMDCRLPHGGARDVSTVFGNADR